MQLSLRPEVPADYPAIAELESAVLNFPTAPGDVAAQAAENPQFVGIVADRSGEIIGRARAGFMHHSTPQGDQRSLVVVAPDHRRLGVGNALWEALLAAVRTYRPVHLHANGNANEMESVRWAERRGFAQTHRHVFQRLDLAAFDLTPYEARLAAATSAGFRLVPFSQLRCPPNEERMWRLWCACISDTPDGQDSPPEAFAGWRSWTLDAEQSWDDGWMVLIAPNGDWAGFTMMQRDGGGAHTFMTGISRQYRGQGLAIPMKVAATRWAREQGLKHLTTLNHASNEPILAVNRSLGYQVVEEIIRLIRPCEW